MDFLKDLKTSVKITLIICSFLLIAGMLALDALTDFDPGPYLQIVILLAGAGGLAGGIGLATGKPGGGAAVLLIAVAFGSSACAGYTPPDNACQVEGTVVGALDSGLTAVEGVLEQHNVDYLQTKTWTTAALFRETPAKVALRKEEGCLAVEMETAAMFAVARFRGVELAQILYSGDAVVPDHWDPRGWWNNRTVREMLIDLAAEACLQL